MIAKRLIGVGMLASLLTIGCKSEQVRDVNIGIKADTMTQYVFRGFEYSDGPVIQPSVILGYDGTRVIGLSNVDDGDVNENHIIFEKDLSDSGITIGYDGMQFPKDGGELAQAYITARISTQFTPSLTLVKNLGMGNGAWSSLSVEESTPIGSVKLSVSHNHEYFREESGFGHVELGLSKSFQFGQNLSCTPYVNYDEPLSTGFKREFYGGVSIEIKY